MRAVEKWAERVYSETDFGRGIATSLSGIIGLIVYLYFQDWVIAVFSLIISFPVVRIVSSGLYEKITSYEKRKIEKEKVEHICNKLNKGEKEVIKAFIGAGGSVLTWSQMNNTSVSSASIESLIQREIMWTSVMADGVTESFVLDTNIFDICSEKFKK